MEDLLLDQISSKDAERVIVTRVAAIEVRKLLEKRLREGKETKGLRIGIRGGGCTGFSYLFEWADEPAKPTDHVFSISEGIDLFVDRKSFLYLRGMELDFVTSMMGYGFKFNNRNAKGACGCGESVQF